MMKGTVTANNVIKGKISGGEVVRGLINKFTAEQIGLGNVDNTSDMDKPVSTAQAEAIADAKKAGTDARTVANEAKEDAGRALDNASRTQTDVDSHIATRNNPHGVTVEQIGAAPAGYGYGGQSVALKNNSLIADEDNLDNELAKIYDAMNVGETKMITFFGYPSNSDWRFFGILSKSSASNGSLIAHSAYGAGSKIIKQKYGGAWQPCEWENPPMVLGVEYRTTERWNGKAVYRKALALGALPVSARSHYRWYIGKNATIIDVTMHAEKRATEGTTTNQDEQYNGNVFIEPADNTIMATATPWTNGNDWYMDVRTSKDLGYLVNTWGEMRYTKE